MVNLLSPLLIKNRPAANRQDPEQTVPKRHEIKQLITYPQYLILSARVKSLLEADTHANGPDGYYISSLYLDDIYESAYYEKINGCPNRKKYRFRAYNGDDSFIALECKEKYGDRISKRFENIALDAYRAFLNGDFFPLDNGGPLCREVAALARGRRLSPRIIVNYRREAYVHQLSNTRITFDTDLSAAENTFDIFCSGQNKTRIFTGGEGVLEIKYDAYFPAYIADALRCSAPTLAISKYVLCRERITRDVFPL